MPTAAIYHGDCLDVMPTLDADSVDAVVTDPPYGLEFMGKDWDHGVPGEHFWREAKRVAKPGAHLLAFGGTRTFHRLASAIEDAGWELRDTIMWVYGSGFPKSLDVSKAIDKAAGATREVAGEYRRGTEPYGWSTSRADSGYRPNVTRGSGHVTVPATPDAVQWDGWGTALKPAWEPIILARKPLAASNVAANVLGHGTGAINIGACRVGGDGRWPANVIHDGSDEVLACFPDTAPSRLGRPRGSTQPGKGWGMTKTGAEYNDSGSAARFFYCAKATPADRDEGLDSLPLKSGGEMTDRKDGSAGLNSPRAGAGRLGSRKNVHPTVKPTALMRWLCRLVTPPGGLVLDPFMGSGSTGKAAALEGFRFAGIELDVDYIEVARLRITHAGGGFPRATKLSLMDALALFGRRKLDVSGSAAL